jgi:hypothetical protein
MGLFGGASGAKLAKPPVYTCLQIQTSALGLPIPIIWGTQRISGNCIDYFGFKNLGSKGKSGKGGKGGADSYSASVIIALCEGSASSSPTTIGRIWSGVSETTLDGLGGGFFAGTANQAAWTVAAASPPGHTLGYSFTALYVHENLQLGTSASLPNINFELFSTFNNYNVPSGSPDANFGDIIPDFLTNTRYGVNLDGASLVGFNEGGLTGSNTSLLVYNYCAGIYVSPLLKDAEQVSSTLQRWANVGNFWIFWSGTALKCVCLGDTPITAVGPHGETVSYIPNTTPIYDLGPDDFQVAEKNKLDAEPPVKVTRKDSADGFNQVQLNCSIRTTNGGVPNSPAYQDTPFRWQDSASIDHVGVQAPNVISSTEICNVGTAAVVVSLIGQRAQYIRNEYAFKLLYYFLLLEPGDIVTLTDPNLGLDKYPVRIKQVDEDDKGVLSFIAEEFAYGVGTANIQEFEPAGGMAPFNQLDTPGPINPPAFLVAPPAFTNDALYVWIALSGPPSVGGCGVALSFDNVTFSMIGEVETASLQGTLTAALPAATGLDTTNTLAIDLTESSGIIPATATDADAQAYRTLCLVDDELLAYGNVSPTGAYTAALTYLERGLYGTTPAAHAAGAPFSRIDPTAVFQYALPAGYLGQTLYFQFPTANLFGNSAQSLADCVTYEFTPNLPTPALIGSLSGTVNSNNTITLDWGAPAGGTPVPTYYDVFETSTTGGVTSTAKVSSLGAPATVFNSASFGAETTTGTFAVVPYNVAGSAETFNATTGQPEMSTNVTLTLVG